VAPCTADAALPLFKLLHDVSHHVMPADFLMLFILAHWPTAATYGGATAYCTDYRHGEKVI
jgi:hypothetical protein